MLNTALLLSGSSVRAVRAWRDAIHLGEFEQARRQGAVCVRWFLLQAGQQLQRFSRLACQVLGRLGVRHDA